MKTFHEFYESVAPERVMIIMRGLSGTGKSTRALQLANGDQSHIFSTDEYFGSEDVYQQNFSMEKLPEAHLWNQERVRAALEAGLSPVIVDNTNVMAYEAKPYVLLAKQYGYSIKIEEPQSPQWDEVKRLRAQMDELARKLAGLNKHGVPPHSIAARIGSYWPYTADDAEKSIAPWEREKKEP